VEGQKRWLIVTETREAAISGVNKRIDGMINRNDFLVTGWFPEGEMAKKQFIDLRASSPLSISIKSRLFISDPLSPIFPLFSIFSFNYLPSKYQDRVIYTNYQALYFCELSRVPFYKCHSKCLYPVLYPVPALASLFIGPQDVGSESVSPNIRCALWGISDPPPRSRCPN
jgi:hypothetical protein